VGGGKLNCCGKQRGPRAQIIATNSNLNEEQCRGVGGGGWGGGGGGGGGGCCVGVRVGGFVVGVGGGGGGGWRGRGRVVGLVRGGGGVVGVGGGGVGLAERGGGVCWGGGGGGGGGGVRGLRGGCGWVWAFCLGWGGG